MRRRGFVAGLTAGLVGTAGCAGLDLERRPPDGEGGPDRTPYDFEVADSGLPGPNGRPGSPAMPADATQATTTLDGERRIAIAPSMLGTDVTGTTLTTGFVAVPTRESPARIWIGMGNAGAGAKSVQFGPTPPFSGYHGRVDSAEGADEEGGSPDAVLAPVGRAGVSTAGDLLDDPGDGSWAAKGRVEVHEGNDRDQEVILGGGETIAAEYALLLGPGRDSWPDREVIRFVSDPPGVTVGLAVWDPDSATRGGSQFDREVSSLPALDRTVWYHRGDSPAFLVPEREQLDLPADGIDLAVHNFSLRPVAVGADLWDLYKLHDGEWKRVAPWRNRDSSRIRQVPVGRTGTGSFATHRGDGSAAAEVTVPRLGPGLYALRFGGGVDSHRVGGPTIARGEEGTFFWIPPPTSVQSYATDTAGYATLLELVGDSLEFAPTDRAEVRSREGEVTTVDRGHDGERAVLSVRRDPPGCSGPRVVIPEQVARFPALWDGVAVASGDARSVSVVTTPDEVHRPLRRLGTGESLCFTCRGSTYLAELGVTTSSGSGDEGGNAAPRSSRD